MNEPLAAQMALQARMMDATATAAAAFAHEKRRVDAQLAGVAASVNMETQLVNSLRQLAAQLKP
ncbi:hypothetical protein WKR88_18060 [Trinickia caryophylli]|uniref:hypothetical protein n=1 Tax=Trinickia caryophylli TaxID=28094 RepID=UPI000A146660|nr:hypothetical protein [Trinickia caryophylli]TRX17806.1 hypothetical protein FNF07_05915 [Trinickia caryophylli]WQE11427.1 hypothetical protein U0034_17000 [Trinickia caryophylli]